VPRLVGRVFASAILGALLRYARLDAVHTHRGRVVAMELRHPPDVDADFPGAVVVPFNTRGDSALLGHRLIYFTTEGCD
jgi:hypothetical protein